MKYLNLLSIFSILFLNLASAEINIGSQILNISGTTEEGIKINLHDVNPKGKTLVYFYPKADTPGCTLQACSLRDQYAKIQKLGIEVIGVSTDSVSDQKAFKQKYRLPFTLIADTTQAWAKAFKVPVTMGFTKRQAFLIQDKTVIWFDRTASTDKQAEDIINFLEKKN
jgi:peroxiredoxin Q/BCP